MNETATDSEYSVEAIAELQKLQNEKTRCQEENIQAEQKRQQEIVDRRTQELTEVKEACHDGQLALLMKLSMTQPDGTRIYILDVPVRASSFDTKKGWETIMVVCKDIEDLDWEKLAKWRKVHRDEEVTEDTTEVGRRACSVRQVEFYHTYVNGGSCSFASVSAVRATNDHEALWETIRSVYTNW